MGGAHVEGAVAVALLVVLAGCSYGGEMGGGVPEVEVPDDVDPRTDPDRDGLNTSLERRIGTDPNASDTDGDRLKDGWEYHGETPNGAALPGADPLHKDLYVQVSYARDIPPLTAAERENLTAIWAGMNVTNPDGERGITIHVDDEAPLGGRVNHTGVVRTRPDEFIYEQYSRHVPGKRNCVYHGTTFLKMAVEELDLAGYGATPGYESVVAARLEGRTRSTTVGSYNRRVRTLTHELLHNVVGNVTDGDDPGHTGSEGWLAGTYVDYANGSAFTARYERLAPETRRALSREGFKPRGFDPDCVVDL